MSDNVDKDDNDNDDDDDENSLDSGPRLGRLQSLQSNQSVGESALLFYNFQHAISNWVIYMKYLETIFTFIGQHYCLTICLRPLENFTKLKSFLISFFAPFSRNVSFFFPDFFFYQSLVWFLFFRKPTTLKAWKTCWRRLRTIPIWSKTKDRLQRSATICHRVCLSLIVLPL